MEHYPEGEFKAWMQFAQKESHDRYYLFGLKGRRGVNLHRRHKNALCRPLLRPGGARRFLGEKGGGKFVRIDNNFYGTVFAFQTGYVLQKVEFVLLC